MEASYQYLLDHTINTPKGVAVNMLLPKKKAYMRKLRGREKGYARTNELKVKSSFRKYMVNETANAKRAKEFNDFKDNGGFNIQLAFWLKRKATAYITKKHNEAKKKKRAAKN